MLVRYFQISSVSVHAFSKLCEFIPKELDVKDTAKNQLKKTLTDLKKDELTKIAKKGGIKRVEDEATNGEDREGELKRSLFDDEVDIFKKYIASKVSF